MNGGFKWLLSIIHDMFTNMKSNITPSPLCCRIESVLELCLSKNYWPKAVLFFVNNTHFKLQHTNKHDELLIWRRWERLIKNDLVKNEGNEKE